MRCPKCGQLILDGIATEYEFMTDREREKITTAGLLERSYLGNIRIIFRAVLYVVGSGGSQISSYGSMPCHGVYDQIIPLLNNNDSLIQQTVV